MISYNCILRSHCEHLKHATCARARRGDRGLVAATGSSGSTGANAAAVDHGREEMCVIVNENNVVIGAAPRRETVAKRLLGRGAYVLLFDGQGKLFVSRRSAHKDVYPGRLDVVISGVVQQGEQYADTAARELEEEVGVPCRAAAAALRTLFEFRWQDDVCDVWGCAFQLTWDGPVVFVDAEVTEGGFMSLDELKSVLRADEDAFTPVGRHVLRRYLEQECQ